MDLGLKNRVENGWAQIDVQLQRRYDLIPNLVETVKGYMQHERQTLLAVTQARTASMSAATVGQKAQADLLVAGALRGLFAVAESYPDLKANQNFLKLQTRISELEERISVLQTEIDRVRAQIDRKQAGRAAAEALFGGPTA